MNIFPFPAAKDERPTRVYAPAPTTYRDKHTPDHEQQAAKLEMLRYRYTKIRSTTIIQRLGDWGRKHFYNPIPGMPRWW